MLIAYLTLFVALLVGLPSIVTAQTLDHQQLDSSSALGTNPWSPGDFGDKLLAKHQTHRKKHYELRRQNHYNVENITKKQHSFLTKAELQSFLLNSGMAGRGPGSPNNPKRFDETSGVFPCPDPTDIAPCVCTLTHTNELMMNCSAVESIDQLAAIFTQNFPIKEFKEFRIENNTNIYFLADIFNGVSFRYIHLFKVTNLALITNFAFADSRDFLESIYIDYSALDENNFPFSTMDEYTKLTYLRIGHNNFFHVPVFNSSSLQTFALPYGHIPVLLEGKLYDL